MKQRLLWLIGGGIVGALLTVVLRAHEPAQPPPDAPAAGRVVFTFADENDMQQFGQMWNQRQANLTRLAVLQAYLAQEQAILAQVNEQLAIQYHVQTNKVYTLDTDRRVLLERDVPAAPPAQPGASPTPASSP